MLFLLLVPKPLRFFTLLCHPLIYKQDRALEVMKRIIWSHSEVVQLLQILVDQALPHIHAQEAMLWVTHKTKLKLGFSLFWRQPKTPYYLIFAYWWNNGVVCICWSKGNAWKDVWRQTTSLIGMPLESLANPIYSDISLKISLDWIL